MSKASTLEVANNQSTLHAEVRAFFEDAANLPYAREKGGTVATIENHDKGHGRIEKRICTGPCFDHHHKGVGVLGDREQAGD